MPLKNALSQKADYFTPIILLPAVLLGVFAMAHDGVSPILWGQQAAASVLFMMILFVPYSTILRLPRAAWTALLMLPLFAVFLFPAVGGARRWSDLGPLNVNAAQLVLPALLVLLCSMARPIPALLLAAAALCLQPDLSQLAAFSLGALPLLFKKREKPLLPAVILVLLAALCTVCAMRPVSLEPVDYCEGVLFMLGGISPVLLAAGAAFLALVPLFLFLYFIAEGSIALLCLAAYYAAATLFGVTGSFPTPFMGFGLSPIAGYFLALLLLRTLHTDHRFASLVHYVNHMVKLDQH